MWPGDMLKSWFRRGVVTNAMVLIVPLLINQNHIEFNIYYTLTDGSSSTSIESRYMMQCFLLFGKWPSLLLPEVPFLHHVVSYSFYILPILPNFTYSFATAARENVSRSHLKDTLSHLFWSISVKSCQHHLVFTATLLLYLLYHMCHLLEFISTNRVG